VRGSQHSHELREFTIDDTGIVIGNMLPDEEGLLGGRPTKRRDSSWSEHGNTTPHA
jgi:circadian clock protein KaiC